jgi:hypothetical protein
MNLQNPTAAQAQAQASIFEMAMANPEMNKSKKVDNKKANELLKDLLADADSSINAKIIKATKDFQNGITSKQEFRELNLSLLDDLILVQTQYQKIA